MSFDFVPGDSTFYCKNCGDDIELWQYRRLALCGACEEVVLPKLNGGLDEQVARILAAFGPDWDIEFLERINDWWEKMQRVR